MPVAALRFPPFVSASRWRTVLEATADLVQKQRGAYTTKRAPVPAAVPLLTNGDVITLVMAWLAAVGHTRIRERFPLWYQYAAAAYGWSPKTDRLDTSAKQRDAWYPDALLVELWRAFGDLAARLEADGASNPRLDLDGRFDDIVFQAEVRAALRDDGAEARFGIPLPTCRRADGSLGPPRCKKQMQRWPYLCEEYEKCAPVAIDDPITVVKKRATNVFQLALLVGAFWLLFDNKPRRTRRTRTG